MIYIGFHLHAYQPPTQPGRVLEEIYRQSYDPVIRFFEENRHASFSLDFALSLAERLPQEFLQRLVKLYRDGRLWLVNTSAYHYLLPLFPKRIIQRQIQLNLDFYHRLFGKDKFPLGVFLPELAFSPLTARFLKEKTPWVMADDGPFASKRLWLPDALQTPLEWIPASHGCGILLRSRSWSEKISGGHYQNGAQFLRDMIDGHKDWKAKHDQIIGHETKDSYIVLAVDFETFGHHHKNAIDRFLNPFFDEARKNKECHIVPLDFISNLFPKAGKLTEECLIEGSWSTSKEDLDRGNPFPLWTSPGNEFHQAWKIFIQLGCPEFEECDSPEFQRLTDTAFYSCSPWQYSHGKKDIARWCLPMFRQIIDLLPDGQRKNKMQALYYKMEFLTRN